MAEELMEKRSVQRLTDAEKRQMLELNALEYLQARIASCFLALNRRSVLSSTNGTRNMFC
jgi:hypothetical protein